MSLTFRNSFVLLSCLLALTQAGMIYRRYEKTHPKYVQVVEIFETMRKPPLYSENDKVLNDFLGRDAFRTDMNCTEDSSSEREETTTTTTKPEISTTTNRAIKSTTKRITTRTPSTVFQLSTDSMMTYSPLPFPKLTTPSIRTTTTSKPPNLEHLTTTRSTKPTIKPNPKENVNPDYTEIDRSRLHVQTMPKFTTPHAEDDSHSSKHPSHVDDDYSDENDEYNEGNYDVYNPDEDTTANREDYDDESDDDDDYDAINRRRKRMHAIRKRLSRKRHTPTQLIS